jgi:DNA invertase Pin-like site-specific DNA recombinase
MTRAGPLRKVRCAVYTRKSSEEGLEQEFNSLHAQREACEAYIASQRHEGWIAVPDRYDDGGISGGTLERPALQRLLRDIEADLIDVVVVYKVDRLSRSLVDFAKLVEVFERHDVSFLSITQQFNTTTSMGRLTLNMLLSFAQFEREVIGERIRDKFAASRARGMWMGGWVPLGYDVIDRKLVVNEAEAVLIRRIFERFATLGSATTLVKELKEEGVRTKAWTTQSGRRREGRPFDKGTVYKILNNRIYLGEAVHKGKSYPGEHEAIVSQALWDRAHAVLGENARTRGNRTRARTPAPLKGLLRCTACGSSMTPSHTRRRGRLYRYYVCLKGMKNGVESCPVRSIAASEIEAVVLGQIRRLLRAPEVAARTIAACHELSDGNGDTSAREREVVEALGRLDEVWDALFPAEQTRILRLLVERIDVAPDGIDVRLHVGGIHSLVSELIAEAGQELAADAATPVEAAAA